MGQTWLQNFNPLGNTWLSTIAAATPVSVLIYFLAVRRIPAWRAAVFGFLAAILVALIVFRMPPHMVAGAVADGLVYGWFRIAWIAVAAVFVYDISVATGQFALIKQSIGDISSDRRLQVLLIAFAFGGLLEGAGGGGAPVAITGAMMIGLGFPPFQTTLLCLIANSAPVAYGSSGQSCEDAGRRHRPARGRLQRDARPHSSLHCCGAALLADSSPVQHPRHPGCLARTARRGSDLRVHPILLVEFHGCLAGGFAERRRHFAGARFLLPSRLETEDELAIPSGRRCRQRARRSAADPPDCTGPGSPSCCWRSSS